ncbi:hypothetical protein Aph01nite_09230 [Acrocarpospora phusangensis]|uniref:SHOCT domain-containing protein n=1 Tax=Acrocarpospora phusangensis TaxID=1070424 RepID=A0A919Q630_9ACTN|nr:SHOCT domain-containing protein [Acrocarpospora phusangensis]GIH22613.1 hypothetical protein Aph01nite_09230 [Acrocarpospora phusangensis]
MPRKERLSIALGVLVQAVWILPLGVFFAYLWLVPDNPDGTFDCGTDEGPHVCPDGEPADRVAAILFLTLGLVALVAGLWLVVRLLLRDRRERRLREHGVREQGVVTSVQVTSTYQNGRPVHRLVIQVPAVPGLEFRHHTLTRLPEGATVTVARDPGSRGDPIVLDVQAVAERLGLPPAIDPLGEFLARLEAALASGEISQEEYARLKAEVMEEP